jgi:hypothetical protein
MTQRLHRATARRKSATKTDRRVRGWRPAIASLRTSNLAKIEVHGNPVVHSEWPANPAGFNIHSIIYQ